MINSREFFNTVATVMADNTEVVEYAMARISKLDEKAKKSAEKREFVAGPVLELISDGKARTVTEIFDLCDENDVEVKSPQALTYILTKLKESGEVSREFIKSRAYYTVVSD